MENNGLIYKKMIEVMAEVPAIGKNQRNQQQGFSYRGIDDVMNALQNILPKHGVFYAPEVLESQREERTNAKGTTLFYQTLKVKYTFYAEDGSSVSAVVQSEGMDSGDKASNKAMSAACKYALFQVFNIPTVEIIDPDATSETVLPKSNSWKMPKFDGVMTLEDAMTFADKNGVKYVDKPLDDLMSMEQAIERALANESDPKKVQVMTDKRNAACLIIENRLKQEAY